MSDTYLHPYLHHFEVAPGEFVEIHATPDPAAYVKYWRERYNGETHWHDGDGNSIRVGPVYEDRELLAYFADGYTVNANGVGPGLIIPYFFEGILPGGSVTIHTRPNPGAQVGHWRDRYNGTAHWSYGAPIVIEDIHEHHEVLVYFE